MSAAGLLLTDLLPINRICRRWADLLLPINRSDLLPINRRRREPGSRHRNKPRFVYQPRWLARNAGPPNSRVITNIVSAVIRHITGCREF